jgi:hypothetical protein
MTMASDFVWNQFLMFCRRNGLLYGHATNQPKATHDPSVTLTKNEVMHLSTLERVLRRKSTV